MNSNDKIQRPSELMFLLEPSRAVLDLGFFFASYPFLQFTPKGDGHPVLVLPGFTASDLSTNPLRFFLRNKGYEAHPWLLGRNLADLHENFELLHKRVKEIKNHHNQKVSLIGWSLGGVYAREIAREMPDDIRLVITLGSPFGGITEANNAAWIYEVLRGKKVVNEVNNEFIRRMQDPPPVPITAIYTKTDGVVAWQHCIEKTEGPFAENIEVVGASHASLGHNPSALALIANRLAQPEGEWKPYKESGQKLGGYFDFLIY